MTKNLVLACLVAILFAGKVHAQTGAPGFSIYNFNSASGLQINLWAAGGAVSTIQTNAGNVFKGSPQGNVQLKPGLLDAIQYVSITGSDGNDGLSWGTAKKTIYAALEALPNGSVSPPQAGNGTVYVSSGYLSPFQNAAIGGVNNGGLWLMGTKDPNYANPPPGWIRVTNGAGNGINIIGVAANQGPPNTHIPAVRLSKGTGAFIGDPAIWISGTSQPINIANLSGGGGARFVLIGQCFNGDRTGTCNVNGVVFENVSGDAHFNAGSGPCTDITGTSYWIWFRDFGCAGNAVNAAGGYTANNAAAIFIDGTGNGGNGLITIRDSNLASGGIKVIPGSGTNGQLFIENVTQEGDFVHTMPPTVWLTSWVSSASAYINNIICADCGATVPTVQIDNPSLPNGPALTTVTNATSVSGPAFVTNTAPSGTVSPLRQGQIGFWSNSIVGQTDVARRNDALVASRFLNRASSNTATCTSSDPPHSTVTTGLTDPFGGTGAAQITHNIAGTATFILGPTYNYTSIVGDWIIVGVWEMGLGGDNSLGGMVTPGYGALTASSIYQDNAYLFEDRWSFRWKAWKISNTPGAQNLQTNIQYGNGRAPIVYGPVFYVIPNGTLSDNEVIDYATSMATTDIACPVGSICNPAGHPVQLTALSLNGSNQMTSVSGNSGQVAQSSGSLSRTKLKTADKNGNIVDAGGSGTLGITLPLKTYASSAICNNTAAASAWNLPTSAAPTVSCRTGTNIQEGTLNFADADSAQFSLPLASDWTGAIDARLIFFSRDTRGTVIFQIATSCTATSGSTVDDIAFNPADVFTTITLNAIAHAQWETNKTSINITGCSPLKTLQVKISRATDTASSRVSVKGLELTVRRAL
jgi:hypothetical protein